MKEKQKLYRINKNKFINTLISGCDFYVFAAINLWIIVINVFRKNETN